MTKIAETNFSLIEAFGDHEGSEFDRMTALLEVLRVASSGESHHIPNPIDEAALEITKQTPYLEGLAQLNGYGECDSYKSL